MIRYATEDTEIGGIPVSKGTPVRSVIAAANRDPDFFDNPHEFNHKRPPETSMNLTFGVGHHACAGQLISRAAIRAVFDAVAKKQHVSSAQVRRGWLIRIVYVVISLYRYVFTELIPTVQDFNKLLSEFNRSDTPSILTERVCHV